MLCAAAMLSLVIGVPDSTAAPNDHVPGTRVQSWAVGHTSLLPADIAEFNNQTVREVVHTSVGGDQVRVRIANTFGTAPLVVGTAHVAISGGGSTIVPGTDRVLTFGGRTSVTVPAGAPALSDPVDLQLPALSDVAVTLYAIGHESGSRRSSGLGYVSSAIYSPAPSICRVRRRCRSGRSCRG